MIPSSLRYVVSLFYASAVEPLAILILLFVAPLLVSALRDLLAVGPLVSLLATLVFAYPPLRTPWGVVLGLLNALLLSEAGVDLGEPLSDYGKGPAPLHLPDSTAEVFLALIVIAGCWGGLPFFLYGLMYNHVTVEKKQTKNGPVSHLQWNSPKDGVLALPILVVCMVLTALGKVPGKVNPAGTHLATTDRTTLRWLLRHVMPVLLADPLANPFVEALSGPAFLATLLEPLAPELGVRSPRRSNDWVNARLQDFTRPRNQAAFALGQRLMALRWFTPARKGKGK
jgi:hypothetical protein